MSHAGRDWGVETFHFHFVVDDAEPEITRFLNEFLTSTQKTFRDLNSYIKGRSQQEEQSRKREVEDLRRRVTALQEENRFLKEAVKEAVDPAAAGQRGGRVPPAPPAARKPLVGAPPGLHKKINKQFTKECDIFIHDAEVHSIVMHPAKGATMFVSASWDKSLVAYDWDKQTEICRLGGTPSDPMGGLYAVAFAKIDHNLLACTSADYHVYLWDLAAMQCKRTFKKHTDEVNGVDFHHQQSVMCTASDDSIVLIWDFSEGEVLRRLSHHQQGCYDATFLGEQWEYGIATVCHDKITRIYDLREPRITNQLSDHTDDVIGIDYSPRMFTLATSSDDGMVVLYDTRTWKQWAAINTRTIAGAAPDDDTEVKRIAFSPSGTHLAAACSSNKSIIMDVAGGKPSHDVVELGGHGNCVFDVAWGECPRSGASVVVTASHDKSIKLWRERQ